MPTGRLHDVVGHIRKLGEKDNAGTLDDRELLERFVTRRDEAAFGALLARHGPMVLDVCRRVLPDRSAADDAFQATFLVLARKAGSIGKRELLGNWLYGVAYRTASKAKVTAAKRKARERAAPRPEPPDPLAEMTVRELFSVLDEELNGLPSRYRAALVLCYLEGKTRDEAAAQLGCSPATLDRRLRRGKDLLRARLARRGVASSAALLPLLLAPGTAAARVPAALGTSVVEAAVRLAPGGATTPLVSAKTHLIPARVAALADGVLQAMFITRVKTAAALVLLLAALGAGAGLFWEGTLSARQPSADPQPRVAPALRLQPPKVGEKEKAEPKPRIIKADSVFRAAWSRDGSILATVNLAQEKDEREIGGEKRAVTVFHSTVKFWDVEKGELKQSLGEEKKVRVGSVAVSPDGKLAAVVAGLEWEGRTYPYEVRVVNLETGRLQKTIELDGIHRVVTFSPDGKTLAIGGQYVPQKLDGPFERTVRLWDLTAGKVVKEFKQELDAAAVEETGYLDGLRDLAFSPDGKLLASADADWKVRLLEVETEKVLQTLDGHTSVILAVAFAPDGKTLVSGSFDETVRVWDVGTGKELRKLKGNKGRVSSLSYSPDGSLVATGGTVDKGGASEVILWDAATWEPKKVLPGEHGGTWVSFSATDGKTLAVGGRHVKLWRVGDLLAVGK
jgi:RNA polymerase sigma factor (sigma-70 family)